MKAQGPLLVFLAVAGSFGVASFLHVDEYLSNQAENYNEFIQKHGRIILTDPKARNRIVIQTLQLTILNEIGDSLECCLSIRRELKNIPTVDVINQLFSRSFYTNQLPVLPLDKPIQRSFVQLLGQACRCFDRDYTAALIFRSVERFMVSYPSGIQLHYIGKPLNPEAPTTPTEPAASSVDLMNYVPLDHFPCKDKRRTGLLCSHLKPMYLSAGNSICRIDKPCDYYGLDYKWCITETGSKREKCCVDGCDEDGYCKPADKWDGERIRCNRHLTFYTKGSDKCNNESPCGYHGLTYNWCYTGKTWDYCEDDSANRIRLNYLTAGNSLCRKYSPCGYHGSFLKLWCYTDDINNWEYCCSFNICPYWLKVGLFGHSVCWAGSTRVSCNRFVRYKTRDGNLCRKDHPCGYHGSRYNWCYTDSINWGYCDGLLRIEL